jgi:hypothetical protein
MLILCPVRPPLRRLLLRFAVMLTILGAVGAVVLLVRLL